MNAKSYFFSILLCCFNLANILSQEIILKDNWHFKTDPNVLGVDQKWFSNEINDDSWEQINLPHLWDLQNQYVNYKGKAWYKKNFELQSTLEDKRVFIELGEIGMSYTLYIDGKKVEDVLAGNYLEEFDVTEFLSNNENHTIALEIDNSLSWGAYWSWGGVRRFVKISTRNPLYIVRQEINSNIDLKNHNANINTTVLIKNSTSKGQNIELKQIINSNEVEESHQIKEIYVPANTEIKILFNTVLASKDLKLWHFDHPYLYECEVEIYKAGEQLSTIKDKFGIRKVEIKDRQLFLNGEKVRLAGYNWVADDRTSGSTLPEFRYKEDIDLMKAAGANLARLSHRPLPEDVMNYLDEVGMLVFAEFNNWPQFMNGNSEEPKLFAKKLIYQNFNHPSIIGWSVGNENGNLKEFPEVNDYTKSIIDYIKKELDSTRLVTYVSNTADFQDNDAAQFGDIVLINKYGNYEKSVDALAERYPNKAVFMSEYGGHTENLIYDTPDKTLFKSLMVDKLKKKNNLIGYSIWTYNDYRSTYQAPNPATATPLHQNRQWGIVDVYRNKKRAFKQMQNFYAPVSALQVQTQRVSKIYKTVIAIQPRNRLDIPSFILKGYYLVWELRDFNNKNLKTGLITLKDIHPGDEIMKQMFQWSATNPAFLKVSLLSSTGYSVIDTTVFFNEPLTPQIKHFIKGSNVARIIFDKNEFSTQYQAYYEWDGNVKVTTSTTDHYIDLNDLSIGKTYKIWLTASNTFGESKASDVISFTPQAGYVSLPPIIWQTQPASESFYTGYSFYYSDAQYRIRYGALLDKPETWKTIATNNFGMAKVPNLVNGQQYYYQISRSAGFAPSVNQWSETISVKPLSGEFKIDVFLHGFKHQNNSLLLSFASQKNAIFYDVVCKTNKGNLNYRINRSAVSLVLLKLPDNVKVEQVTLQSILKYN